MTGMPNSQFTMTGMPKFCVAIDGRQAFLVLLQIDRNQGFLLLYLMPTFEQVIG